MLIDSPKHGKVQKLMDDLDLPPDRANLFEVIDADGSGTLKLTELVQGLLKIRGVPRAVSISGPGPFSQIGRCRAAGR